MISGQRIVQTKTGSVIGSTSSSNIVGKPIVIVSKPLPTTITTVSTSSSNSGIPDKPTGSQVTTLVTSNSLVLPGCEKCSYINVELNAVQHMISIF